MQEKEREDKALSAHNQVLKYRNTIVFNRFLYVMSLRVIVQNEFWRELDCESFEMYHCQPEVDIGLIPATVKKYIKIIDDLLDKGMDESDMKELTINKLDIMRNARKPVDWVDSAKTLGYSDLKKEIYKKEKGIEPMDEVEKALKEERSGTLEVCKNMKNGKCQLGAF